ncbi:MAG: AAA family ATPase [Deltaproteobacteria bacterium]|nr:AAA family ATPase [Deltaproteobacteria bacterium]
MSDGETTMPPRLGGQRGWRDDGSGTRFVGRRDVVAAVLDALARAGGYEARVVVLHGERGIGKTRTAAEVAMVAERGGRHAAWGRAWDDAGGHPFHLWEQALRAVAVRVPRVARRLGAVLKQLVAAGSSGPAGGAAPLALCEAVTALLSTASSQAPLLVVLDDIHLADAGTLSLLQFVSRQVGEGRFVVLATCRDEAVVHRPELAAALGGLDQRTRHVTLTPLGREEVREYLRHAIGADPDVALIDAVWERSGGNAFFLDKLSVLCATDPRAAAVSAVPPGVREEVLGYRLSGLSDACRRLLHVAAVLGRVFAGDVLESMLAASGQRADAASRQQMLGALDGALDSELIRPVSSAAGGQFTFVHGLVRDALYDGVSWPDRSALHRAAADALARRAEPRDAAALEQLAYHFERTGERAGAAAAAGYAAAAADQYAGMRQDGRAAAAYERALADLDDSGETAATVQRATWLLALAAARRRGGDRHAGRLIAARAVDCARRVAAFADPESSARLLIAAAVEIGAERAWARTGVVQDDVITLLQDAMRLLPEGDGALRARGLAALATELYHSEFDSGAWRASAAAEAVAMARRVGDAETLAHALRSRHVGAWFAETLEGRLQTSAELITLVRHLPDLRLRAEAHLLRGLDLLESGDMVQLGRQLHFCRELAREGGGDLMLWHADVVRATHATFEGRIAEAEQLSQQALEAGQRIQPEDAGLFFGVQTYTLRRLRGDFEVLLPLARDFAQQFPTIPLWRIGVADLYAQLGRQAEARAEFEYFAATTFSEPPRDWNWLLGMALLGEVCAFLGDRPRAAILYEHLLPFAAQNVTAVPGLACIGSTAYQLGLLATVLDRPAEAAAHFTAAAQRNLEMGGLPYAAHAQRQHAAMLVQRLEDGHAEADAAQAAALLDACTALYARLGLQTYDPQLHQLAVRLAECRRRADRGGAEASATVDNVWRRQRNGWLIVWRGQRAEFPDLIGLHLLAQLIRHSPVAVPVAELESVCGVIETVARAALSPRALRDDGLTIRRAPIESSALDPRVRTELGERLGDIEAELAEAQGHHDLGRIELLCDEREQILHALRGSRRIPADEMARKRVFRNIRKTAIPLIAAALPDLADHLATALYTGRECHYRPTPAERWAVHTHPEPAAATVAQA